MSALTISEHYTPEQLHAAIGTAREQLEVQRQEIASHEARYHQLANRVMAVLVLDTHAEWILTGDPRFPTLYHMIFEAYVSGSDDQRLRAKIGEIRMSYLAPGGPKVDLRCFLCTLPRTSCLCCPEHRVHELMPDDCAHCAETAKELGL